jgi:hypothetical protein
MKALISPEEQVNTGYRVAQVEENEFEVAPPLFWTDCSNEVIQDQFWYDPTDEQIKPNPILEQIESSINSENQKLSDTLNS